MTYNGEYKSASDALEEDGNATNNTNSTNATESSEDTTATATSDETV